MRRAIILLTCAWVLWGTKDVSPPGANSEMFHPASFSPYEAFQTREACETARAHFSRAAVIPYIYRCLPDTIDPRSPKR